MLERVVLCLPLFLILIRLPVVEIRNSADDLYTVTPSLLLHARHRLCPYKKVAESFAKKRESWKWCLTCDLTIRLISSDHLIANNNVDSALPFKINCRCKFSHKVVACIIRF